MYLRANRAEQAAVASEKKALQERDEKDLALKQKSEALESEAAQRKQADEQRETRRTQSDRRHPSSHRLRRLSQLSRTPSLHRLGCTAQRSDEAESP